MYIDRNTQCLFRKGVGVCLQACAFALYTKPEMKDVVVLAKILKTLKSRLDDNCPNFSWSDNV